MSKYKAICCDIDGTLLTDDKKITDLNKECIQHVVKEQGVKFVITSGRMLYSIRKIYTELGITGLASCCNGTCFFDENDNLVQDFRVEKQYLPAIIKTARNNNLDLVYIVGNDWYMENTDNFTYRTKINFYFKDCIVANFDRLIKEIAPNKMVAMSTDPEVLANFERELRDEGIDESVVVYYRGTNFIEIMPSCADKSLAIDVLSKSYNIPVEQIVAIGDDYNDVNMIQMAGLGVAMANGIDEVKKVADFITLSNEEDGVASVIQKFF